MRRWFMPSMIVMLALGALLTPFAQVEGQAPGGALCEQARATGQLAGYEVSDGSRGGGGNQVLLGTDGPDVLRGGGGNDILCGFGGDDTLIGGTGNDILVGGEGADDLRGNSGNDTFVVDADDSRVRGGSGNDRTQVVTPTPIPPTATATSVPLSFTYNVSSLKYIERYGHDGCDGSWALTGAPPSIPVAVKFVFYDYEDDTYGGGTTSYGTTSDVGSLSGGIQYVLEDGDIIGYGIVTNQDTDEVIVRRDEFQTCGDPVPD